MVGARGTSEVINLLWCFANGILVPHIPTRVVLVNLKSSVVASDLSLTLRIYSLDGP